MCSVSNVSFVHILVMVSSQLMFREEYARPHFTMALPGRIKCEQLWQSVWRTRLLSILTEQFWEGWWGQQAEGRRFSVCFLLGSFWLGPGRMPAHEWLNTRCLSLAVAGKIGMLDWKEDICVVLLGHQSKSRAFPEVRVCMCVCVSIEFVTRYIPQSCVCVCVCVCVVLLGHVILC